MAPIGFLLAVIATVCGRLGRDEKLLDHPVPVAFVLVLLYAACLITVALRMPEALPGVLRWRIAD